MGVTAEPPVAPATATADATGVAATVTPAVPVPAKTFATTQAAARPVPAASPADAGSLGGTVFALLLVVGLILGLGWLAKRMPGFGRGAPSNGLRMVASLPIGPRERVVVVEVGETQLLLGVGPGGTRTLHTLAEPLPEAGPTPAPQFAQLLAQHFGKKA
ncbi:flagellar biosynthetic protein FliO [Lysobacter korlensis]|uniref:Flagellar protein n=1 Tax=Lysobacter korlensis TaxID=553636 RepID=A0ABV6RJA3_9GAMM